METVRTDVVVVGAGAAGLLAAVAARRVGHEVLVVEASPLVGGASAVGDGRLWLPANHLMDKLGVGDSAVEAAEYLDVVLGTPTPASTDERRGAFVETAPKLARWLTSSKVPLQVDRDASDDYPDAPGAKPQGRVLRSQAFDRRVLGEWANALASTASPQARPLSERVLGRFGPRHASHGDGEALTAELLHRAVGNGVELWLESPATALLGDDDGVHGVIVRRLAGRADDAGVRVEAAVGVILAAGGFEASQELREENLPLPTDAAWSASRAADDGSAIRLAVDLGAATAGMDDAWWTPVLLVDGVAYSLDGERRHPHAMIVDQSGSRFLDEAAPAVQVGRQLYDRSHGVRAIPSYFIMDNHYHRDFELGPWAAGSTPRSAIESGDLVKANTLNELAQSLGIDRAGLLGTTVRFNGFARKGRDQDFDRGEGLVHAGGGRRRNPSLGSIDKAPFWAVKVYPGDVGTKGGLLVDADARVLRSDGSAIAGLYACGGTAASLMGRTSPAPGAGLAESLVGAFRAVLRISGENSAR